MAVGEEVSADESVKRGRSSNSMKESFWSPTETTRPVGLLLLLVVRRCCSCRNQSVHSIQSQHRDCRSAVKKNPRPHAGPQATSSSTRSKALAERRSDMHFVSQAASLRTSQMSHPEKSTCAWFMEASLQLFINIHSAKLTDHHSAADKTAESG